MPTSLFVLANKLNLRSAPETGRVIAVLPRGQLLDGVPDGAARPGWTHVTTTLNLTTLDGFVADQYVSEIGAQAGSDAAADGTLGVTVAKLRRLAPTGRADILDALARDFAVIGAAYGLTASAPRICHFLAQATHETMGLSRLRELGGPSYFARYEGRKDLGNVQPGDGVKFHGRGIFQLTGRANYTAMSPLLGDGVDLVANPDRAMEPSLSLRIACIFWSDRGLNGFADADNIGMITKRINGGHNGLAERTMLYEKARTIWT
jgi:putative chitinase